MRDDLRDILFLNLFFQQLALSLEFLQRLFGFADLLLEFGEFAVANLGDAFELSRSLRRDGLRV